MQCITDAYLASSNKQVVGGQNWLQPTWAWDKLVLSSHFESDYAAKETIRIHRQQQKCFVFIGA